MLPHLRTQGPPLQEVACQWLAVIPSGVDGSGEVRLRLFLHQRRIG